MYHPAGQADESAGELEFLELKNIGASVLDLSGLLFTSGIEFVFPKGSTLAPGGLFLLGKNRAALQKRYPGLAVHGIYRGRLANEGETLTLSAGLDAPVLNVTYDDAAPWPEKADGYGFSLNADAASELGFRASSALGGTPGGEDPGLAKPLDEFDPDGDTPGQRHVAGGFCGGGGAELFPADHASAWPSVAAFDPFLSRSEREGVTHHLPAG